MRETLGTGGGDGRTTVVMYIMPLNWYLEMITVANFMLCVFYQNKKKWEKKNEDLKHATILMYFENIK